MGLRNTPTPVGKTSIVSSSSVSILETPPRLWGRPLHLLVDLRDIRNTPTPVGKTVMANSPCRKIEKHPHACGEDFLPSRDAVYGEETPPRLWGRLIEASGEITEERNTPTPVGKTYPTMRGQDIVEKHPHACGEDYADGISAAVNWETPPRLWGRLFRASFAPPSGGNTPTPVGKTDWPRCARRRRSEKHPHACGEDHHHQRKCPERRETPPRLWGRRGGTAVNVIKNRNTPTPVGKTYDAADLRAIEGKHPHACGEDSFQYPNGLDQRGNTPTPVGKTRTGSRPSPSTWKHPHACGEDVLLAGLPVPAGGNTPTPVGKTCRRLSGRRAYWKHPHACGEDMLLPRRVIWPQETPPRLWGRLCRKMAWQRQGGNTPTPVGKTSQCARRSASTRKHPHACGEDQASTTGGSSI